MHKKFLGTYGGIAITAIAILIWQQQSSIGMAEDKTHYVYVYAHQSPPMRPDGSSYCSRSTWVKHQPSKNDKTNIKCPACGRPGRLQQIDQYYADPRDTRIEN